MNNLQLITGNKNYSSSSLRAWLFLKEFKIPFTEIKIDLFKSDTVEKIGIYSPSLQVPVLIHNEIKVWDSLAICDYISEVFLRRCGWPSSQKKRAAAKSICMELHADFQQFKQDWPMNCQVALNMHTDAELDKELARLEAIMYCCRRVHGDGGDYLFGEFSIVDCMFAPFAISLNAYGAQLNWKSRKYLQTLLHNQHLQAWLHDASLEQSPLGLEKIA